MKQIRDRKRGEAMREGASWKGRCGQAKCVVRRVQGAGEASSTPSGLPRGLLISNTWPDRPELPSPLAHFSLPFLRTLLPLK